MSKTFLALLVALCSYKVVSATHLRGGLITYSQLGCTNTYSITVTVFLDTESGVKFGGNQQDGVDVLDFGDGSRFVIPETNGQPVPPFQNVGVAQYTIQHTYLGPGVYLINYQEPNRNEHVLNMTSSVLTPFSITSMVVVGGSCGRISSRLLVPTVLRGTAAGTNTFSLAQGNPNGYRLRYTLITPAKGRNQVVSDYFVPDGVSLNSDTGVLTWRAGDHATPVGEYAFAVRVEQFEENQLIGYVDKDLQVILEQGGAENQLTRPDHLGGHNRVFVGTTDSLSFKIIAQSKTQRPSLLLMKEEIDSVTISTYDSTFEGNLMTVGVVTFFNNGIQDRTLPYTTVVRGVYQEDLMQDVSFLHFIEDTTLPDIVTAVGLEHRRVTGYPNPTMQQFEFDNDGRSTPYRLVDAWGVTVQHGTTNGVIDLGDLPTGIYLLYVGLEKEVHRIVKQ